MKQLFGIKNNTTGKTVDGTYSCKQLAKRARDELCAAQGWERDSKRPDTPMPYSVVPGPDHKRFKPK